MRTARTAPLHPTNPVNQPSTASEPEGKTRNSHRNEHRTSASRRVGGGAQSAPPACRWVVKSLAEGYAAAWALVLASTLTAALVPGAAWLVHALLGLPLHVRIHPAPPPTVDGILLVFTANIRATCWPLIPAVLGASRFAALRWLTHAGVALSVVLNLLPVGTAFGVYGPRLVPYLPQLPFELYAVSSGATCWWGCCVRRLGRAQLAWIGCSMVATLVVGAVLESWGTPHR